MAKCNVQSQPFHVNVRITASLHRREIGLEGSSRVEIRARLDDSDTAGSWQLAPRQGPQRTGQGNLMCKRNKTGIVI